MSSNSILTRFGRFWRHYRPQPALDLHSLYCHPEHLPKTVRESAEAMRYLNLLGPLAWDAFPERDLQRSYGQASTPYAAFAAICLIKLDQGISSFSHLSGWLADRTPLAWLLGFRAADNDFNPVLPTPRHFPRLLKKMPNTCLQFLLNSSVEAILSEISRREIEVEDIVSLDTKHVIAWVKENNPKQYLEGKRYDKTQQPKGDPDCKLGCKRRHNQHRKTTDRAHPATPAKNPVPADKVTFGEFYWGYASGVVAIKIPSAGELVVAEFTQPFDRSDVSYFFPLMAITEQRLGHKPRFGALDAAFDAFYVYDYFHEAGGFAAVPFSGKGKVIKRKFNADGLPLCAAGKPMPLKATYWDRTTAIIEYERGQYACPLFIPTPTGLPCPINDKHWAKGGCISTIATSTGARIRHQLDRNCDTYKHVYKQRTAVERIFSQAKALGIERPMLRNGEAIANYNTLIYIFINLRLLQRLKQQA